MSWCRRLVLSCLCLSLPLLADDQALWQEYGLVHSSTSHQGNLTVTSYQMKDATGALAAWEWLRPPRGRSCNLSSLCSQDTSRTVVSDYNYLVVLEGASPTKPQVEAIFGALPAKRDSAVPAILTFLPQQNLVPNSTRYLLGLSSLAAFLPQMGSVNPGFDTGAEAQVADYKITGNIAPTRLALFYYPTPGIARQHAANFKSLPAARVKRSGVLVAVVPAPPSEAAADTVLSRVQYQAKVTWNDTPPPSPIKPLYRLLVDILYISCVLSALCLLAGLMYAGMRIYRRRFGTLDADEAMTTLHLSGD